MTVSIVSILEINHGFCCHLQVEVMKKKMPWLKYDMVKAKYMEAKKQEKDANKKLSDAAKTLNDHKEPIEYVTWFLLLHQQLILLCM